MVAVAVVALAMSPGVNGPFPDESNLAGWAIVMAGTNIPPILILPYLFRLDRGRLLLAVAAWAGILAAQVALRVPPNLFAVEAYVAVAGIAKLTRDNRDFATAILAVAAGVLAGVACGYNPCTPIELILAPLTGIIVRKGLGKRVAGVRSFRPNRWSAIK
jgi:hypothetical protein